MANLHPDKLSIPAAVFNVGDLLDDEKMRRGPLEVLWAQDKWIEPNRPLPIPDLCGRPLRARLMRLRPFWISIRVAPPDNEADLGAWGRAVAAKLGTEWLEDPKDGDKAVWLLAHVFARQAGAALGSAGRIFHRLDGFQISQAQVRVWEVI